MQSNGFFSIVFIVLALVGISWEHTTKPNQEVVVQFSDDHVSCDTAQNTIALVKLKLQDIGVENIQVVEEETGRLKITYYSVMGVDAVKRSIANSENLSLAFISDLPHKEEQKLPVENDAVSYELNISEIQQLPASDVGSDGFILELQSNHDRYVPPVLYYAHTAMDVSGQNQLDEVAYLAHRYVATGFNFNSRTTPEVRAGPIFKGFI